MRVRRQLKPLILSVVVAGCAGPKPPTGAPAKTAPGGPLLVEAPIADLSPVSAPKNLIVVARAERLDNVTATVAGWMNLPFDLRMLDTLGPGLSQTLRVDVPIEAAVVLSDATDTEVPQPYAVFSAGLSSVDAGRKMFEKFGRKLEETSPGVWLTVDESPVACGLAPAVGRASVRVVCGNRRVDVENLLPYATRGLPLQSMGTSDVHLEIKLEPIRQRYSQRLQQAKALAIPMALHELGFTDSRLSRPLTDILYALGDEVVNVIDDLDRIVVDSRLAHNPDRVDISTMLDFTRAHSWSAQVLAEAAKHSSPAPASLFDLPRDAALASYITSQSPKSYENLIRRLSALIDGSLAHIDVNAKLRDEFSRSLDRLNAARTSSAVCGGMPRTSATVVSEKTDVDFLEAFSAWQVCIYDEQAPVPVTALLDAAAKIVADPAFRKAFDARALTFRRRPATGLVAGSVGYELKFEGPAFMSALTRLGAPATPKSKDKPATAEVSGVGQVYIYVVPDGSRTLMGMGTDMKEVVSHLTAIKKMTPENRLGAVGELSWLRSEPAVAGGFFTLSYVMAGVERRARIKHKTDSKRSDVLATAPHHGITPVPFVWAVHGDANEPKLECDVRMDRAVFEDIASVSGQYVLQMAK